MRLISAGSQVRILSRPPPGLNPDLDPTRNLISRVRVGVGLRVGAEKQAEEEKARTTVLSLRERRSSRAQTTDRLESRAGSLTSTYRVVSTTFRAESETFGSGFDRSHREFQLSQVSSPAAAGRGED
jgi:hypothetical protein